MEQPKLFLLFKNFSFLPDTATETLSDVQSVSGMDQGIFSVGLYGKGSISQYTGSSLQSQLGCLQMTNLTFLFCSPVVTNRFMHLLELTVSLRE